MIGTNYSTKSGSPILFVTSYFSSNRFFQMYVQIIFHFVARGKKIEYITRKPFIDHTQYVELLNSIDLMEFLPSNYFKKPLLAIPFLNVSERCSNFNVYWYFRQADIKRLRGVGSFIVIFFNCQMIMK